MMAGDGLYIVAGLVDMRKPVGPTGLRNHRKFRFCHLRGYKGDRLVVGFYNTYIKEGK